MKINNYIIKREKGRQGKGAEDKGEDEGSI
jgi:hypothetical protein